MHCTGNSMLSLGKALPECHRGGKSTRPDRDSNPGPLACRASTLANWATEPHWRPATISPSLNRFVPESSRNHAGTLRDSPFAARSPSTDQHWATKFHRGGKCTRPDRNSNPGPLSYRASTLENCATELHGRPANPGPFAYRASTIANWAAEPHGRPEKWGWRGGGRGERGGVRARDGHIVFLCGSSWRRRWCHTFSAQ